MNSNSQFSFLFSNTQLIKFFLINKEKKNCWAYSLSPVHFTYPSPKKERAYYHLLRKFGYLSLSLPLPRELRILIRQSDRKRNRGIGRKVRNGGVQSGGRLRLSVQGGVDRGLGRWQVQPLVALHQERVQPRVQIHHRSWIRHPQHPRWR